MGLARTLKDQMLFNEGQNFLGQCQTVTLPTLTRKMEEKRLAGMNGPVSLDMGMEGLKMSFVCPGPMRHVLRQWGEPRVDGTYLRWVGNYQMDDTAAIDHVEVVVRGRHSELEMGDQESGEAGSFTVSSALAYYKLVWNGRVEIEIDFLRMIERVDGVDRLAERRALLGIF